MKLWRGRYALPTWTPGEVAAVVALDEAHALGVCRMHLRRAEAAVTDERNAA